MSKLGKDINVLKSNLAVYKHTQRSQKSWSFLQIEKKRETETEKNKNLEDTVLLSQKDMACPGVPIFTQLLGVLRIGHNMPVTFSEKISCKQ